VENMPLEGALTVTFVRSLLAHAKIDGVDASAAEAVPNVQVITAADLDLGVFGPEFPDVNASMGRPLLAVDRVRFVGDIIAIVVSDDSATGADARAGSGRIRPTAGRRESRVGRGGRGAAVPGGRHERRSARRLARA
jgi:CO/xanthine dehydrogenase Mo-binding subunit